MSAHPEYPDLLPGFRWEDVDADGVRIRAAIHTAAKTLEG